MSRRNLVVIVNWRDLDHAEAGGAELYCEEVARRLAAAGQRVVLLTSAVPGRAGREERAGFRIVRGGGRFGVYPRALLWLLLHRRRIAGVIDSQNGIPFFTPLAVSAQTPVLLLIHHVHQQQFDAYFSPPMARVGRWLEGPASRRVYGRRAVVAASPSTRRAARLGLRLVGPILVASPGAQPPLRAGRTPDERAPMPRVVCVGRMVPHKRIHLAIEAFPAVLEAHPEAELHLVGDGPVRPALEKLAAKVAGGRVVFHGAVSNEARDTVVRSAWVGVNPSAGEGWGISVIEANALGVPVVGLRVAGLRDSIRHGETGWLVETERDLGPHLAGVIGDLADPVTAAAWSQRTVAWAARASWDETTKIIDRLLQSERGRLLRSDRRQSTDLATHVHIPASLLPPDWTPVFRLTDRAMIHDNGLSVVLPGSDLRDVPLVLRRAGLPPGVAHDPRLRVRIARPADFVDPAAKELTGDELDTETAAVTMLAEVSDLH